MSDEQTSQGATAAMEASLRAVEEQALASCHQSLIDLQNTAPDWFAFYEDSQADSAERATLVELMRTAPNDYAKGLVYGFFIMRQTIASMTDRKFD